MNPVLWPQNDKNVRETFQEKLGGGVRHASAETLTLFQTKICDFPYLISDLKPWGPARDRSARQVVTARTR